MTPLKFVARKSSILLLVFVLAFFNSPVLISVLAQKPDTITKGGEITFLTGNVFINGTKALFGATVLKGFKVQTLCNSAVTISLGKMGFIRMYQGTELILDFSDAKIGGSLTAGRVLLNAPAGVKIEVITTEGVATADGKQHSVLEVDMNAKKTRVSAIQNTAKFVTDSRNEPMAAGTEISIDQKLPRGFDCKCKPQPPLEGIDGGPRKGISRGAIIALLVAGVGGAVAGILASQTEFTPPVVSGFRP